MKKKNRRLRRVLLLVCSAAIVVGVSVSATIAYLTDYETVTNTFSVGKVYLTLDEEDVDDSTPDAERDQANKYHLLPGKQYAKDPIVHIQADSDPCWVFVKVENDLAEIEDNATYTDLSNKTAAGKIADQIEAFGWTKLDGVANVYYRKHETKSSTVTDYTVFTNFRLIGEGLENGTKPGDYTGEDAFIGDYANAEIKVTAYAIQAEGFSTAAAAWAAGEWK